MLIAMDSTKGVEELAGAVTEACGRHAFGVLGTHDLRAKLREKGQEYDRACLVLEVCNPEKARRVLEANPEISTALPCRISIFEKPDGGARLATIRPTLLLDLFGTPELRVVAEEVEATMRAIMEEAAA